MARRRFVAGEPGPRGSEQGIRLPWSRSDRPIPRTLLKPLQQFLETETASGVLLLGAVVVALVWANSPWGGAYERLWERTLDVRLGGVQLAQSLRHWVNEGSMSFFFLVVGLEIKRELTTGELRHPGSVVLPAIAALGGMILPALLYVALNVGGEGAAGWGIPMATDIAFALGVLTLATRSAPGALRPFLLTLAIVDDLGAIVVIALFYSEGLEWPPLAMALGVVAVIIGLQRIHVRAAAIYVLLGIVLWLAVYESGVHATIAGAVLGLLTPSVPFQRPKAVSAQAHRIADETVDEPDPPDADAEQWLHLVGLAKEAVSPLARVENLLHPWTSWVVVPIFALANAGIRVSVDMLRAALSSRISLGVVLGLVVGKLVGISLASWGAARLGWGRLAERPTPRRLLGTGAVAGIGFTVSLFVAELAFGSSRLGDAARLGVFAGSLLAGALGYVILRSESAARTRTAGPEGTVPAGSRAERS